MNYSHQERIIQRASGKWDIQWLAANGRIIVASRQAYSRRIDAVRSLEALKAAIRNDTVATHG